MNSDQILLNNKIAAESYLSEEELIISQLNEKNEKLEHKIKILLAIVSRAITIRCDEYIKNDFEQYGYEFRYDDQGKPTMEQKI